MSTIVTEKSGTARCQVCSRQRTDGNGEFPQDAFDYSAFQVVQGKPFGWYSGSDGEICGYCFGKMFVQANVPLPKRDS